LLCGRVGNLCQILYIPLEHGRDVGLKPGIAAACALASHRWQIINHSVDDYLPKSLVLHGAGGSPKVPGDLL
jgi:hypothetical protein